MRMVGNRPVCYIGQHAYDAFAIRIIRRVLAVRRSRALQRCRRLAIAIICHGWQKRRSGYRNSGEKLASGCRRLRELFADRVVAGAARLGRFRVLASTEKRNSRWPETALDRDIRLPYSPPHDERNGRPKGQVVVNVGRRTQSRSGPTRIGKTANGRGGQTGTAARSGALF